MSWKAIPTKQPCRSFPIAHGKKDASPTVVKLSCLLCTFCRWNFSRDVFLWRSRVFWRASVLAIYVGANYSAKIPTMVSFFECCLFLPKGVDQAIPFYVRGAGDGAL